MDFSRLRKNMVERQIANRGITNKRILSAFLEVPREEFVPPNMMRYAYEDGPVSIGFGQTISQPYMSALMIECLDPQPTDKVLEIGTGLGYQAAVLSRLSRVVYTVERIPGLAEQAKVILDKLGYNNVVVRVGDGTLGWPEFAPYDKIIVSAGAPSVPRRLLKQLKKGGRMVIPVGPRYSQVLKVISKLSDDEVVEKEETPCVFVPLIGEDGWQE